MILKLLFLHKNKNIDIEELKNDFSSVFEIKNNEFIYKDINYKFDIVKAQESNNIVFSISTTKSGNNLENAILIEDIKNGIKKENIGKIIELSQYMMTHQDIFVIKYQ